MLSLEERAVGKRKLLLFCCIQPSIELAPVVQKMDNAIHRINHYPANSVVCFV